MSTLQIIPLPDNPEHAETAATWIYEEWGKTSREEGLANLLDRSEAVPPALIAISHDVPVGVLGFKFHRLAEQIEQELWVNVLYVHEDWRSRGIGFRLLEHGMQTARGYERSNLFVYTDIPAFYEKRGWILCNRGEESPFSVLRYALS